MQNRRTFLLVLVLLLFSAPAQALAHATPVSYTPASQAVVTEFPSAVEIYFTERIEPEASSIRVFTPDGSEAHVGKAVRTKSDRHYGIELKDLGEQGVYTVSWQVVSADDGHFTKGAFAFLYGEAGADFDVTNESITGQIQILHVTTLPEAALGLINLLGQALVVGALIVFGFLARRLFRNEEANIQAEDRAGGKLQNESIRRAVMRRYRNIFLLGLFAMLAGTLGFILIKTLDLAQLRSTSFSETLQIFLQSNAGSFALMRFVLALVLAFIFVLFWKKIKAQATFTKYGLTKYEWTLLAVTLVILYAQSRVSHAAASHFFPELSVLVTTVHLFAKDVLVGGALASLALYSILRLDKEGSAALHLLARYAKVAILALIGVGVTGAYIVWLHLKNFSYITTSEWGNLFLLLLTVGVFFAALRLAGIALLFAKNSTRKFLAWLRPMLVLEFLVGIVLLFFSGYISITTPPYLVEDYAFEQSDTSGELTTTIRPHTFESDKLLIEVTDATGSHAVIDELIVSIQNNTAYIGPLVLDATQRYEGGYLISQSALAPAGEWDIRAVLKRTGAYDEHAQFTLNYPDDITNSRVDSETRAFDTFALVFIAIGLLTLFFGLLLYRMVSKVSMTLGAGISTASSKTSESARVEVDLQATKEHLGHRLAPYALFVLALISIWFLHAHVYKSDFQQRCEADGNFWIQSAVMRNGETLSPNTTTGCTLNLGLYHFATLAEYDYYFKDANTLETRAELTLIPESPTAGEEVVLELKLSSIEDGIDVGPIEELTISHDRKVHMLLIGEDMQSFVHIHPETSELQSNEAEEAGIYRIAHTFEKVGRYILLVDYVVKGREIQKEFFIDVSLGDASSEDVSDGDPNDEDSLVAPPATSSHIFEKDGYRVTLKTPDVVKSDDLTKMTFTIEKDGKLVDTLGAYLAAPMHIAVIRHDFGEPMHTHGEVYMPGSAAFQGLFADYITYHSHFVPAAFGPKVQARLTFAEPGMYQIFAEFLHKEGDEESVVASTFTVKVE